MSRPLLRVWMRSRPSAVPQMRAAAAEQAGAADDDGGDGVQLVALAEVGRAGDDPGGQHHAGEAGEQAAERVDAEQDPAWC